MSESHDQHDWEEFVHTHYQEIFSFCFQFSGNRHDAEDATQATFLKAWRKFSTLRNKEAARGWLYQIARNSCLDQCRWWKRFLNFKQQQEMAEAIEEDRTLAHTLQKLIAALPVRQREVFILRHWHGFSTQETAQMLGLHPGTVKSHLKRSIDSLRKQLDSIDLLPTTDETDQSSTKSNKEQRI